MIPAYSFGLLHRPRVSSKPAAAMVMADRRGIVYIFTEHKFAPGTILQIPTYDRRVVK